MTFEQWFAENKKYIYGADVDAWCEAAFNAGYAAGRKTYRTEVINVMRRTGLHEGSDMGKALLAIGTEVINDPAEIRRVFEIDEADYPPPDSGFAKL